MKPQPASNCSTWRNFLVACFRPVDAASAILFRILFAALAAGWAWNYLASGRVTQLYVDPQFHFTYAGFQWVHPWSGDGMYLHFIALMGLAMMILTGCFYRVACLLFALGFTYVFLLERTNYQNHYYLILLLSWTLPWLPLNRMLSVDAYRRPQIASQSIPAWALLALRFHIALPYLFGGIAKWTSDWMLGQPMEMFLSTKADLPVIGTWLAIPGVGIWMSWCGMFFDLAIVPGLLFSRTRKYAFLLCIGFHLTNAVLFSIHIFPWLMIAGSTIFFRPDWPRRFLSAEPVTLSQKSTWRGSTGQWVALGLVIIYAGFQVIWPLRSRIHSEPTSWTERGHLFSWRMMLRAKEVGIGFALRDPATEAVVNVDHMQFLSTEQSEKFARDPNLILQMAHFIADKFEQEMRRRPQIYAFALVSLNGRKPQLMIDPNTDLASLQRNTSIGPEGFVTLHEPLRSPAWDIPIDQWRNHVDLPEIKFLQRMSNISPTVNLAGTHSLQTIEKD
ncbi:Vitamin K-dependent gamma-carboxylase [Roseimaritima multifibrata]|uniref:Vitamin K-dependent gamma-carboxylase n=1 Tax=Roseimaritima multifibrata TaxID=1930274 RepID=A0A517MKR9_9BACT|nr:HTTM domain-containing protein [Roseimaritima multifibrata]QDS95478.1 Vitamin K-dependent gamma-carboxylase [Roseimaritima multifibrata]